MRAKEGVGVKERKGLVYSSSRRAYSPNLCYQLLLARGIPGGHYISGAGTQGKGGRCSYSQITDVQVIDQLKTGELNYYPTVFILLESCTDCLY